MSFTLALLSVWISLASGITLGPTSSGPSTFGPSTPSNCKCVRPATSCSFIKNAEPGSQTGYYPMIDSYGNVFGMYCNMDTLCGSGDGWSRIGYLDMSDASQQCPTNWNEYTKDTGGIRTCKRKTNACDSVIIPAHNISYSEICGRVVGYQYASTDALQSAVNTKNINQQYVDGISITHGSPRQHVWTLMSGLNGNGLWGSSVYQCPCHSQASPTIPSFIGNDWYCESGNDEYNTWHYRSYMNDKLWDGQQCGSVELQCCQNKLPGINQPWFHKQLPAPTTDYIELRICSDQGNTDEDTLVNMYEIYVK